jgi:hypothetical protein
LLRLKTALVVACAIPLLAASPVGAAAESAQSPAVSGQAGPLSTAELNDLNALYRTLIEAENRHDLAAVRKVVWQSPLTLFVAKTATAAEGNWAGFWGTDVVLRHFADLYAGTFVMDPDYPRVKTVGLTSDVAETYAPLNITVAYGGQTPVPKPFLMIVTWLRTSDGWKMATDIALPMPPAPHS